MQWPAPRPVRAIAVNKRHVHCARRLKKELAAVRPEVGRKDVRDQCQRVISRDERNLAADDSERALRCSDAGHARVLQQRAQPRASWAGERTRSCRPPARGRPAERAPREHVAGVIERIDRDMRA